MSFENDITQVKNLVEGWKEHPDPSGLVTAAHEIQNVLLVWWYNLKTAEFRKDKQSNAQHKDNQEFMTSTNLTEWVRGRVFKFQGKVYLMIYTSDRKHINNASLVDILDFAQNNSRDTITRVVDDSGNPIEGIDECQKSYKIERSKLGAWRINESGIVVECLPNRKL